MQIIYTYVKDGYMFVGLPSTNSGRLHHPRVGTLQTIFKFLNTLSTDRVVTDQFASDASRQ